MSVPFGPFVLTLDDITTRLRGAFGEFIDPRKGRNQSYTMVDAALSAFSVFFTQSPSFLDYQRSLQQAHGNNNARTLFGVHAVPSDHQIRTLLDATPPERLGPVYGFLFGALAQAGVVDSYRAPGGALLLALDGTEYFSSQAIRCEHCSTRRQANGQETCFHTVLTPVLVKPGSDKVIPLAPEFIRPQDGADKQDCELNAAKRWLAGHGADPALRGATVLGDDLYCHEPFGRALRASGFGFVLVCKPGSHPATDAWLDDLQRQGAVGTVAHRRWTGRRYETDTYRWAEAVPLRDADDALMVNGCELVTTDDRGKVLYRNAFATDRPIDASSVAATVAAGRCRWKVENENNNTLKTGGYRFEHNYGHGRTHLASVLASLIILAFLTHNVLEWMDAQYRLLRQKLPRQRLFNDIRALTSYLCFQSWEALMAFMLQSFEPLPASPETG